MSYKTYLMEAVGRIQRDFGDYTPSAFPAQLLADPSISDQTAYQMAKFWRDVTTNNYRATTSRSADSSSAENEMLNLRLHYSGNKVIVMNTRTHGAEAVFTMEPNGLFAYHGPRKYATLIGGRGELGDMLPKLMTNYKSLSDHDLLKDHEKHKN
ncbi:MAG: hypothetical protein J4469_02100 [Candidatus Aenigmarchaeota archaeon]|nr:hypothetical protein [Candidatus Aenigmarchaeota archaeon]